LDKTRAIRVASFGGPEVLALQTVGLREPGPGQITVEHRAIGLNMVDTYYRAGLYPLELPSGLGSEAAGIVESIGDAVTGLAVGDRIAYVAPPPLDAYSQRRVLDAKWAVTLPDEIDDATAAAMMLKGLTTWYLLRRSYRIRRGEWMLLYAAAGGVGLIMTQWAKHIGARVIGVVGTEAKRALAIENGCDEVLLSSDDVVGSVRELTQGAGVPVVYDSIGRATFSQSLDCLRPHGFMVSFGNASGPVDPVPLFDLMRRGSLYLTRPTLFDFVRERAELETGAAELFKLVSTRKIQISVHQRYPLAEVAAAHDDLEQRRTTGSTILIP